jgi:hypothetical protein
MEKLRRRKHLCECGCGEYANPGCRFIKGHSSRMQKKKPKPEPRLCECGCGEFANSGNRFIRGHNPIGIQQSEEHKLKRSISMRGKTFSNGHRAKLSKAQQSDETKERAKATWLEKYGVTNPSKSEEIKEKKIVTSQKKYGVDYPMQSKEVKENQKITCLKNLGVENPLQNAKVAQSVKNKKGNQYIFPSGNTIIIEGNENKALDQLLNEGYKEEELIVTYEDMPEFWYTTLDGKVHRYFPDIFIPKDNLIVEVKARGNYWVRDTKGKQELKRQSVLDGCYNFKLMDY